MAKTTLTLLLAALLALSATAWAVTQNDIGKAQEGISNINWNIRVSEENIRTLSDQLQECQEVEGACDQALTDYYADELAKEQKNLESLQEDLDAAVKDLEDLQQAFAEQKQQAAGQDQGQDQSQDQGQDQGQDQDQDQNQNQDGDQPAGGADGSGSGQAQ